MYKRNYTMVQKPIYNKVHIYFEKDEHQSTGSNGEGGERLDDRAGKGKENIKKKKTTTKAQANPERRKICCTADQP